MEAARVGGGAAHSAGAHDAGSVGSLRCMKECRWRMSSGSDHQGFQSRYFWKSGLITIPFLRRRGRSCAEQSRQGRNEPRQRKRKKWARARGSVRAVFLSRWV